MLKDLHSRRRLLHASRPFENVLRIEQSEMLLPPPGVKAFQPAPANWRQGNAVATAGKGGNPAVTAPQHSRPKSAARPAGQHTMHRSSDTMPDSSSRGNVAVRPGHKRDTGAGPGRCHFCHTSFFVIVHIFNRPVTLDPIVPKDGHNDSCHLGCFTVTSGVLNRCSGCGTV